MLTPETAVELKRYQQMRTDSTAGIVKIGEDVNKEAERVYRAIYGVLGVSFNAVVTSQHYDITLMEKLESNAEWLGVYVRHAHPLLNKNGLEFLQHIPLKYLFMTDEEVVADVVCRQQAFAAKKAEEKTARDRAMEKLTQEEKDVLFGTKETRAIKKAALKKLSKKERYSLRGSIGEAADDEGEV